MTAGHDEIRGSGPDQVIAPVAHWGERVFLIPGLTGLPSNHTSPSHYGVPRMALSVPLRRP